MLRFLWRHRFGLVAAELVGVMLLAYLWLGMAGRTERWLEGEFWYAEYYSPLADAFARGQTHLPVEPAPELLALPDPYDPVANAPYRFHDALLYQGRYYLYWGPVPALLLVPLKWLGVGAIPDAYLMLAFLPGTVVFSVLLIHSLWRRLFPALPWWTALPGILVAGLGHPIPAVMSRPLVYEAAIAGGQCFLMAGLYWTLAAFAPGRRVPWRMALGGCCLALAVGTRSSLVFAAGFLVLAVAWRVARLPARRSVRSDLTGVALYGLPPLLAVIGLCWYNYIRFDSWSEFGLRYQLFGASHAEIDPNAFSVRHVLPNLYNYLLRPFGFQGAFPYYVRTNSNTTFPGWIVPAPGYGWGDMQVTGILWSAPYLVLGMIPLARLVGRFVGRGLRAGGKPMPTPRPLEDWFVACLFGTAVLGMLIPLFMSAAAVRYLADCTPSLVVLASVGAWQGYRGLFPRLLGRTFWGLAVAALALASAFVGVLFSTATIQELRECEWLPRWHPDFLDPVTATPVLDGQILILLTALGLNGLLCLAMPVLARGEWRKASLSGPHGRSRPGPAGGRLPVGNLKRSV